MSVAETSGSRLQSACSSCRKIKIKCVIESRSDDQRQCMRCVRLKLPCTFDQVKVRARRTRTDARVEDLGKKIAQLTALISQSRPQSPGTGDRPVMLQASLASSETTTPVQPEILPQPSLKLVGDSPFQKLSLESYGAHLSELSPVAMNNLIAGDVQLGIRSLAEEDTLFEFYTTDLMPCYPLIPIRHGTSADHVRQKAPFLFLAIITVAAGSCNPLLACELEKELSQMLAKCVFVQGMQSPELVSSLLIWAVWYRLPETYARLNFAQYIQIASTMITDLDYRDDLCDDRDIATGQTEPYLALEG